MKYHQDMTRCIFRIFKTTKADEGLLFTIHHYWYLLFSLQANIRVKLMMIEVLKHLVIFMLKVDHTELSKII